MHAMRHALLMKCDLNHPAQRDDDALEQESKILWLFRSTPVAFGPLKTSTNVINYSE